MRMRSGKMITSRKKTNGAAIAAAPMGCCRDRLTLTRLKLFGPAVPFPHWLLSGRMKADTTNLSPSDPSFSAGMMMVPFRSIREDSSAVLAFSG